MSQDTRERMEERFGEDFGDVRVHTDAHAVESAEALQAEAYTRGRDIYFAMGKYAPKTSEGERLLEHELAHTLQQRKGGVQPETDPQTYLDASISRPEDPAEREADALVTQIGTGKPVSSIAISPVTQPSFQRQAIPAPAAGVTPLSPPVPTTTPAEGQDADLGFDPAILVPAGMAAEDIAALREAYAQGVKAIRDEAALMLSKGASPAEVANWANAARNNLKKQIRDQGPGIIKLIAEARNMRKYGNPLGLTAEELRAMGKTNEEIIESAGRGSGKVTKWAGRLRIAGRIAIAIDIGIAAYRVATAPEVDRPRVLLEEVGGIGGALAGAALGAKGGAWAGGAIGVWFGGAGAAPGAVIGGFIGGIGGAIAGAWGGRKLGGFVADEFYPPSQTGFEGEFK